MEICNGDLCLGSSRRKCPEPVGYRIRSNAPIWGALWPKPGERELEVAHRCVAVSLAAKSRTEPGAAIQVIHVDSGQVVFQKPTEPPRELPAAA
ncbi:hypothetical protein [Ramlibacter alkalitolerans]|uniref:DUF2188 domain-containing protein n=1 Tax=Ramlibacter alkalitolerans TaxID=2039631 RepID=A0ABS1JVS4_9BURK|nr:hypothetical protein [Ramlibacter alkalitolerans]MBL0428307.1 hypothetical protein [Ramlibacter alkalitolerans]